MDDWDLLLRVTVGAAGALMFLKFVADELGVLRDELRGFESREKRRYEKQFGFNADSERITTAQKIGNAI